MSLDLNSTVLDLIKAVNKASSVPVATSSALGGIKIGYSASGANIPVELSSVNQSAYVELTEAAITEALGYVPLNDESISITSTLTSGTEIGSVKVGDTTTKLYAPTATAVDFAGLDVWAGGVSNIDYAGVDGICWEDTFAFTDSSGFETHTGKYYGRVPIEAGDNVSFTIDHDNQVIKINATGGSGGSIGDVLEVGSIKIDGESGKLENIDSPNNNIYIGDDTVDIEGIGLYLRGDTHVAAQGHIDLSAGQDTGTYITLETVDADDRRIDINSDKIYLNSNNETIIWGTNNVGIYTGDNDNAYIDVSTNADSGVGLVAINAETTTFYGSTIAFNSLQIAKYDSDVDNIDFMFNGGDAGITMSYDSDGNSIVDIYGDKVTINGNSIGSGGSSGGWRQVTFDEFKTSCDTGTIVRLVPTPDGDSNFESPDIKFKNLGLQFVCGDGGYFCVRNTELDPYTTDTTQLCFDTYELLRDEDDFIYATVFTTVYYGSAASTEHREHVYELDDSNCEFYIWEG